MQTVDVEEQVKTIMFGSEYGDATLRATMGAELRQRLIEARAAGRPLRVYAGYDPSKPDLHLGHSITMRKLRQFQDFGHDVTFVVGTFTAQVGDTSDKATGRPRLTPEQVFEAAKSYAEQAFTILDRGKTTVVYNHEWLAGLTMADVITLASNFTVQQFLVRDNYRRRIDAGSPVGLHEFFYALLQGHDAVHLRADVQLGATEQLFNILAGRKLQEAAGQKPCIPVTYPILVGMDGKARMSKSTGNYVGLAEPPEEQYGKVMSISDETMLEWIKYVTRWPTDDIEARTRRAKSGELHPMELKKALAREVVAMYHGEEAAERAQKHFETVHQEKSIPDDIAELVLTGPTAIVDVLVRIEGVKSKGEARRLIDGRGVKIDGEAVEGYDRQVTAACLLQVGKRRFVRVRVGG
jgi:tyrosyl-tRNA synthetase